ncbi:MAG: autotransporter domain-containing protein [Phycisphaerales bacterium]|nr:autotransporter domain-containing protein [Phycisphaerae bacterium]NNF43662.1 autotransporter domain-containing protein [Phycisphaerales bacterium]NNM26994.1 autotransporter domain-containing protein [Phycisphaerales bacterium]
MRSSSSPASLVAAGPAAAALIILAMPASADFIWDGGAASDLWTAGANWVGNVAPPFNLGGDNLIFAATGGAQSPDAGDNTWRGIDSLAYTGADAKLRIIGTGRLIFTNGATITNDSTFRQRIDVNLEGRGDDLIIDAATGEFRIDGAIDLDHTDGVTLTIMGAEDTDLNGVISGTGGALIKSGTGTLTLTGANTYDGGTELSGGVIILGNNTALGDIRLRVTADGAIRSNNDNRFIDNNIRIDPAATLTVRGGKDLTLNGIISRDGAMTVNMSEDEDEVTLNGENTFTGGITLKRGTIVAGDNDAFGTGDLTLTGDGRIGSNDGTIRIKNDILLGANELTFTGSSNLKLTGIISGAGGLVVDSETATLRLLGDSTFTGDTRIFEGGLRLDGSVAGRVVVRNNGTLSGGGRVGGNLIVRKDGFVSPGGGIDTLTIDGNYTQQKGATLQVTLGTDAATADLLDIGGTALLERKSNIAASVSGDGYIVSGEVFTVIDAAGGVTDEGATVTSESATLTVEVIRDPDFMDGDNEYRLQVIRADDAYANAAEGANNLAIAASVDSLVTTANAAPTGDAADLLAGLDALSAPVYNEALQQLSPTFYEASPLIAFNDVRAFTNSQASHLRATRVNAGEWAVTRRTSNVSAPPSGATLGPGLTRMDPSLLEIDRPAPPEDPMAVDERLGTYVHALGLLSRRNSETDALGFDADSLGLQAGVDYRFSDGFTGGLAVGYTTTNADRSNNQGDLDLDTIRVGPYFTASSGAWFVDGSITTAFHTFDGQRRIPTLDQTASGDYDAFDLSAYLGTGVTYELGNNLQFIPVASVQFTTMETDGFTERGDPSVTLIVDDRDVDAFRFQVGAHLAGFYDAGVKLAPDLFFGWEHDLADEEPYNARFTTGGDAFNVRPPERESDHFLFGAGVTALLESNLTAFIRYEAIWSPDDTVSQITGGLSWTF